jgi:hypothetical protein
MSASALGELGYRQDAMHRRVFGVTSQWAEEPPCNKLATLLRKQPSWRDAIGEIRAVRRQLTSRPPTYRLLRWCLREQWFGIHTVQGILANYSLPATPCTARYAMWVADGARGGRPPTWPTRGVLVTAFQVGVGVRACGGTGSAVEAGEVVRIVSGSPRWMTVAVDTRARTIVAKQAEQWRKYPLSAAPAASISNLSHLNSRQGDAAAREEKSPPLVPGTPAYAEAVELEMLRDAEIYTSPNCRRKPLPYALYSDAHIERVKSRLATRSWRARKASKPHHN